MRVREFKEKTNGLIEDHIAELDELCLKHLMQVCAEYGEQGETAKDLLRIVAKLLEIYL